MTIPGIKNNITGSSAKTQVTATLQNGQRARFHQMGTNNYYGVNSKSTYNINNHPNNFTAFITRQNKAGAARIGDKQQMIYNQTNITSTKTSETPSFWDSMSAMDKVNLGLMVGQAAVGLGSAISGMFNTNSMNRSNITENTIKPSNTLLSGMNGATDSASLRQAIANAETRMNELSYINNNEYKQMYTDAQKGVEDAKTNIQNYEKEVETAQEGVSTARQAVKSLTETRNVKKGVLENAITKKNRCSSEYAKARTNVVAAEAHLASIPEKIRDNNGNEIDNPAYTQAKKALETAEEQEKKAKSNLDKATKAEINADKDVQKAEQELVAEQTKLDNAENELKANEDKLAEANKKLTEANQELEKHQAVVDKYEKLKKEYEQLKTEIPKQKERLAKIEKEEEKEFDKLSKKVDKENKKVDRRKTGGITKTENKLNESSNKKIESYNNRKSELENNIAKNKIMQETATTGKDNAQLRSGKLPNGSTVYFIGYREVTVQEYNAALPA